MIRHKIIPLFFLFLKILMELLQLAVVTFLMCAAQEVQLKRPRYCDHQAEVHGHLLSTVPSQSIFYVKNRVYSSLYIASLVLPSYSYSSYLMVSAHI